MSEDGITYKLEGGDKLIAVLLRIDRNMQGPAAEAMVESGGRIVEFYTKVNIGRTFSPKQTGALWNSVRVETERKRKGAVAHIRPYRIYARIQELGGYPHRPPKPYIPPRPYLKPAILDHQSEIVSEMAAEAQEYMK